MKTDEDRRNDPKIRAKIEADLRQKAVEAERLLVLAEEMKEILSRPTWRSSSGGLHQNVSAINRTLSTFPFRPEDFRAGADNPIYVGNLAATERSV